AASMALHLLVIALLLYPLRRAASDRPDSPTPVVTVVNAADLLSDPQAPPSRDDSTGLPDAPDVAVDGFTFDVDKIARRRNALFPFVTDDFAFHALRKALEGDPHRSMHNPYGTWREGPLPTLRLRAEAIQRLVDRTWSRRDRWNSFAPV